MGRPVIRGAVTAAVAHVSGVPFVSFGPFEDEDEALDWASALTLVVEIPHDTRAEAGHIDSQAGPVHVFVGPFDTVALARSWLDHARSP